jgi:hypothetical protein
MGQRSCELRKEDDKTVNKYRKLGYFGRSFILVYLVPLMKVPKVFTTGVKSVTIYLTDDCRYTNRTIKMSMIKTLELN